MKRYRIAMALLAAAALSLASTGCGGDDDDGEAASTTTTEDGVVGEDEYRAAFAESLQGSDGSFDATEEEARCATDRVVNEIGADRLQEAGVTVEFLESDDESGPTDLTQAESETVADAFFECIDVAAAFAESFAEGGEFTDEDVECVSRETASLPGLRSFVARGLRVGSAAVMEPAEAEPFADALIQCIDFAPSFAQGFGQELTPEEEVCVNAALRSSDVFRDYLVGELTGEVTDQDQLGAELAPELQGCFPGGVDLGPA